MAKKKVFISWSTGKDAAWSTYILQKREDVELMGILCVINKTFERTSMHSVRMELLGAQAEHLGLPLMIAGIPYPCSNEEYQSLMSGITSEMIHQGATHICFGDLYLKDVREYREDNLKSTGLQSLFPLWKIPTKDLAREMIEGGLKAVITCVDPQQLDTAFLGREYDAQLLSELPDSVDPCGENGEFHTCVYGGPFFHSDINIRIGEILEREGLLFADVLLR